MKEEQLYIDLFDRYHHKEINQKQMVVLCEEMDQCIDIKVAFGHYRTALDILEQAYIKSIVQEAISA